MRQRILIELNFFCKYLRIRFHQIFGEIILYGNFTLQDFCNEPRFRTLKTLLLGLYRYPFIDDDSEEETTYMKSNFYLNKNDEKVQCYGLAAAYLYATAGIGFFSEPFWDAVKIELVLTETDNGIGLIIQTTGKNIRETSEIARILKEKYS
ncbi:MAG: hypothetical protein GY754_14825 [bacterium]|nr:hypothetical protein [bacterium]